MAILWIFLATQLLRDVEGVNYDEREAREVACGVLDAIYDAPDGCVVAAGGAVLGAFLGFDDPGYTKKPSSDLDIYVDVSTAFFENPVAWAAKNLPGAHWDSDWKKISQAIGCPLMPLADREYFLSNGRSDPSQKWLSHPTLMRCWELCWCFKSCWPMRHRAFLASNDRARYLREFYARASKIFPRTGTLALKALYIEQFWSPQSWSADKEFQSTFPSCVGSFQRAQKQAVGIYASVFIPIAGLTATRPGFCLQFHFLDFASQQMQNFCPDICKMPRGPNRIETWLRRSSDFLPIPWVTFSKLSASREELCVYKNSLTVAKCLLSKKLWINHALLVSEPIKPAAIYKGKAKPRFCECDYCTSVSAQARGEQRAVAAMVLPYRYEKYLERGFQIERPVSMIERLTDRINKLPPSTKEHLVFVVFFVVSLAAFMYFCTLK